MNKRILFVVHRYAPYPGGSENYVRDMAEETLSRGNHVAVFAGTHKGNLNGIHVTSDSNILTQQWDLIVVHGGNINVQDFVLNNSMYIQSPILFMLILPSESNSYANGLQHCKYIGYSTIEDKDFIARKGKQLKAVQVRHGIDPKISTGIEGFRKKHNITTKYMFLSCGGFWPHKAMNELAECFEKANRHDTTLVLTGYDNRNNLMPAKRKNILPIMIDDRDEVMSAISEADLYIMHSFEEGFGLVLLESMLNKTPWAARNIAGAKLMKDYGFAYDNDNQLIDYLKTFEGVEDNTITASYNYMIQNHTIVQTVDDILCLV